MLSDNTTLVLAWATLIGTAGTAIAVVVTAFRTNKVYREVKTWNESSIGQLEAASETRRIKEIPADDRSAKENRHVQASDKGELDDNG